MPSDWHSLVGVFGDLAGTSGTATLPAGAVLLTLSAHASAGSATFQIFNGATVPVINGAATLVYTFEHTLIQAKSGAGNNTITFTNTDHYYLQWVVPKGTSAF